MNNTQFYILRDTTVKTLLVTINTKEYLPVEKRDITWKWEERVSFCDGYNSKEFGFVPYINNKVTNLYKVNEGRNGQYMDSIIQYDGSDQVYSNYYNEFNLVKPETVCQ
jgi:hypothetical protein